MTQYMKLYTGNDVVPNIPLYKINDNKTRVAFLQYGGRWVIRSVEIENHNLLNKMKPTSYDSLIMRDKRGLIKLLLEQL